MSTIPLSAREGYGQTLSGEDAPPPEQTNDKLDAVIESAFETITTRDEIKEDDETLLPVTGDGWANLVNDPEREAPAEREAGLRRSYAAAKQSWPSVRPPARTFTPRRNGARPFGTATAAS